MKMLYPHVKYTIRYIMLFAAIVSLVGVTSAEAARGRKKTPNPTPKNSDVQAIRDNYWSSTDPEKMDVVQNRLYTKASKIEIQGFGGFLNSDPFLSVKGAGGSVGYHFSEYFAV